MPKHQRPDFESEPSMDAIRRADDFIDALALGRPAPAEDAADAELAALLGNWRDEMRWPPATGLITEEDAVAALNAGRSQKRLGPGRDRWVVDTEITPRKSRRGLSVVGAAAAAVLCIGGFGAVVAGSGPGDGLYGLRTMLFGTPKEVRDDQVGLAAKTTLNQVQDLIAQGDWSQAQNKLVEVSTQVASIGDQQQKQDLLDQFNDLSAKVVERDPAATAPPGVVYTVPPSAAELVPAVAPPTSTPSAPQSPSDSATSTTTESPTSATSSSPSSTAASTPAPTSSESPSADTQSAQTTTPTSAAPSTTDAPAGAASTTTAAPEPPTTAAPVTTVDPAEKSAAQTPEASTAAPAQAATTADQTTAAPTTAAPTTATQTAGAETTAESPESAVVTSTEPIPLPVG